MNSRAVVVGVHVAVRQGGAAAEEVPRMRRVEAVESAPQLDERDLHDDQASRVLVTDVDRHAQEPRVGRRVQRKKVGWPSSPEGFVASVETLEPKTTCVDIPVGSRAKQKFFFRIFACTNEARVASRARFSFGPAFRCEEASNRFETMVSHFCLKLYPPYLGSIVV